MTWLNEGQPTKQMSTAVHLDNLLEARETFNNAREKSQAWRNPPRERDRGQPAHVTCASTITKTRALSFPKKRSAGEVGKGAREKHPHTKRRKLYMLSWEWDRNLKTVKVAPEAGVSNNKNTLGRSSSSHKRVPL